MSTLASAVLLLAERRETWATAIVDSLVVIILMALTGLALASFARLRRMRPASRMPLPLLGVGTAFLVLGGVLLHTALLDLAMT